MIEVDGKQLSVKKVERPGGKITSKVESDDLIDVDLSERRRLKQKAEMIDLDSTL